MLKIPPYISAGISSIIPGGISIVDFSAVTKLSLNDSKNILNFIVENNIGKKDNDVYYFESGDKLRLALFLIKHGFPIDEISIVLHWRDFEGLTAEILSYNDFAVIKNMVLTKPRMEIDVVGIRLGIAILIDCKHWKQFAFSSLKTAVKNKLRGLKNMLRKLKDLLRYPLLLLYTKTKLILLKEFQSYPFSNLIHLFTNFMAILI